MEWYRLRCAGLSDSKIRALLKVTKNFNEIYRIDKVQLMGRLKFTEEDLIRLEQARKIDLIEEMNILIRERIKLIFIEDETYPKLLKNISSPPLFLYCRGDISKLNGFSLGIVGTRKSTSYGRGVTEKIVDGLVEAGIATVSGLALGIDSVCHRRTIYRGGRTIAVVGSGLDVIYPSENRDLWEIIPRYGVLISEFPLGTQPTNYNFPQRNRIISGLSKGIVVTESKEKGGSLITAEFALEEGREVFAVPGDIFSPYSAGCNNLIKNSQAKLITGVKDILEEYGIGEKESGISLEENSQLTELEKKVYNNLIGIKNLDELIMDTGYKPSELLTLLMELEMKELVISVAGGGYRRKK